MIKAPANFKKWSQSKVWHNKLPINDHDDDILRTLSGFIYSDNSFIALTTNSAGPNLKPMWWSIVEQSECYTKDLDRIEEWLWEHFSHDNIIAM